MDAITQLRIEQNKDFAEGFEAGVKEAMRLTKGGDEDGKDEMGN